MIREDEEKRLRTEDLGVERVLRNDDGDNIDKRNKLKLVMKEKL